MKGIPPKRPTIRVALILGFGLTLGLWLFSSYRFTARMAEVQTEAAAINARYIHSQELLSTVRAQTLLGSVYVRDALLDPDPGATVAYRRQLEQTQRDIDQALEHYVPVLNSSVERERLGRLRHELEDFRATLEEVIANDNLQPPAQARVVLSRRVVPQREIVMRVSEEVQALNRADFVQQQTAIADIYRTTQGRVRTQFGFALAASLGIALLATLYAGRLESRLQQQRERDVQMTQELQELSAKLITAQEEERRRIARELHDEVGQVLTAIKLELAVAQRRLDATGGSRRLLEDAQSITDSALITVRDLSHLLHPALLDDLGLPAAIEWYLRGFGKRYGVRVELLHERMDDRLQPEIEATAYRVVQEALTNIAKHAHATSCRVYVQRLPKTVLVTVEDNGVGFDPALAEGAGTRRGLGLIGIRERVSQVRGTLRLESSPDKGTRLTVELPARSREGVADVDPATPATPLAAPEVLHG